MATRTLSFQKRARNPFSTPAWESSYTSSTGTNLLGAEYYAISYKCSPYNGSDVQSVTNIVFKAILGGDWAQSFSGLSYRSPAFWSGVKSAPMSLVPQKLSQLEMERWLAAQQKRSVWPMIQLVMKPP